MENPRTIFPELDLAYSRCPRTVTLTQAINNQHEYSTQTDFSPRHLILADMRDVEECTLDDSDMRTFADLVQSQCRSTPPGAGVEIIRTIMLAPTELTYDIARQLQVAGQGSGCLDVSIVRDDFNLLMTLRGAPSRAQSLLADIFASEPNSSLIDWLGQAASLSGQASAP